MKAILVCALLMVSVTCAAPRHETMDISRDLSDAAQRQESFGTCGITVSSGVEQTGVLRSLCLADEVELFNFFGLFRCCGTQGRHLEDSSSEHRGFSAGATDVYAHISF